MTRPTKLTDQLVWRDGNEAKFHRHLKLFSICIQSQRCHSKISKKFLWHHRDLTEIFQVQQQLEVTLDYKLGRLGTAAFALPLKMDESGSMPVNTFLLSASYPAH